MQRGLDPGPRVRGGCHTGGSQSVEQESKSGGKRRQWRGGTRMEPKGNIRLHLVRHGKRTTAEVATQDKEKRHTRVPVRTTHHRAIGRAPGGKVLPTNQGEEPSREKRAIGVEVSAHSEQDRKERNRTGRVRKNRDRKRGGQTGDFLL